MARERKTALGLVGEALGIKPDTLRARLYYHKVKIQGLTPRQIVRALEKHGTTFTARQTAKIGELLGKSLVPEVPAVHHNPRDRPEHTSNLRLAKIAARQLVQEFVKPAVAADRYGKREGLELELYRLLHHIDEP